MFLWNTTRNAFERNFWCIFILEYITPHIKFELALTRFRLICGKIYILFTCTNSLYIGLFTIYVYLVCYILEIFTLVGAVDEINNYRYLLTRCSAEFQAVHKPNGIIPIFYFWEDSKLLLNILYYAHSDYGPSLGWSHTVKWL